jgi:hypothetical protein
LQAPQETLARKRPQHSAATSVGQRSSRARIVLPSSHVMLFELYSWLISGLGFALMVIVPIGLIILFALGIYEYNFDDQYKPRPRTQFTEKGKVRFVVNRWGANNAHSL